MEGRQLLKVAAGYFCIDVGYAEDAVIIAQTVIPQLTTLFS